MALTAQERAARDEASYVAIRSAWQKYFKKWYGPHFFLGSLLLVFAALAASATKIGLSEYYASIFSFLVVILTGSIGFFINLRTAHRGTGRLGHCWTLSSAASSMTRPTR